MSNTKKTLIVCFAMALSIGSSILIHDLCAYYYESINVSKVHLSWGIVIRYSVFYIYPVLLLGYFSQRLFFKNIKVAFLFLFWGILLYCYYPSRPNRVLLLVVSMFLGFLVGAFIFNKILKKTKEAENNTTD